eukprot:2802172-Prymnesium_polylepis.1
MQHKKAFAEPRRGACSLVKKERGLDTIRRLPPPSPSRKFTRRLHGSSDRGMDYATSRSAVPSPAGCAVGGDVCDDLRR